jgi:hypothetical protein
MEGARPVRPGPHLSRHTGSRREGSDVAACSRRIPLGEEPQSDYDLEDSDGCVNGWYRDPRDSWVDDYRECTGQQEQRRKNAPGGQHARNKPGRTPAQTAPPPAARRAAGGGLRVGVHE